MSASHPRAAPDAMSTTRGFNVHFDDPLFPTGGWDSPRTWVLPTLTLALAPLGIVARYTRASMLDVIRADYTLTARAKGLGEWPVIFKHALKNALIPIVTLLGPIAWAPRRSSPVS